MLDTLRGRLVLSYSGVVLPALLLATVVYLVLGISYRQEDAYRQLTTGLYLVAPQIENVLIRERIRSALAQIEDNLLQITQGALHQDPGPARRAQVEEASERVRADLAQIDAALAPGATQPSQRIAGAV